MKEDKMGTFEYRIGIGGTPEGPFQEVMALVDTGATYSMVPASILRRLGIRPLEKMKFETADSRIIEKDVAEVPVRLDGRVRYSIIIFGDENTQPLLGAFTLEAFSLGVDPRSRRLIPVTGLLKSFCTAE